MCTRCAPNKTDRQVQVHTGCTSLRSPVYHRPNLCMLTGADPASRSVSASYASDSALSLSLSEREISLREREGETPVHALVPLQTSREICDDTGSRI